MLFDDNNFDYNFLNLANLNFSDNNNMFLMKNDKLVSSKEGFLRGNMFANEYVPYKNMTYRELRPKTEREELLFKVMEMNFAINDLNLYLDIHPEDRMMYEKFKEYTEKFITLKDEYARKYGPLCLEETSSNNYNWYKNPWPWDNGGDMYV